MDRPILVDTNILVEYLRGRDDAVAFIREQGDRIILSSIVVAELYAGVRASAEQVVVDDLVSLYRVIPVTARLAKAGGLLRRDFAKSHGVGLADAIIAATAKAENAQLCTLNVRHYPMIPDLQAPFTRT